MCLKVLYRLKQRHFKGTLTSQQLPESPESPASLRSNTWTSSGSGPVRKPYQTGSNFCLRSHDTEDDR